MHIGAILLYRPKYYLLFFLQKLKWHSQETMFAIELEVLGWKMSKHLRFTLDNLVHLKIYFIINMSRKKEIKMEWSNTTVEIPIFILSALFLAYVDLFNSRHL